MTPEQQLLKFTGLGMIHAPLKHNKEVLFIALTQICKTPFDEFGGAAYPITMGMINPETGKHMVRLSTMGLHQGDTIEEALSYAIYEYLECYYSDYHCDKCRGITQNSKVCENPNCPNQPS